MGPTTSTSLDLRPGIAASESSMVTASPSLTHLTASADGLHYCDANLALGSAGNLVVLVWRKHTTLDGVRRCRDYVSQRCLNRGCEFAILSIIEAKASLPDMKARQALAEILQEGERWFQVSGLVFEGNGFFAATIRSVVTGITLLAQQKYPHRVFEGVASAAKFLEFEQRPGNARPFTSDEIVRKVAALRQQVAERESARRKDA